MAVRPLTQNDAPKVLEIVRELEAPGVPQWTLKQWQDEIAGAATLGLFQEQDLIAFIVFRRTPDHVEVSFLATKQRGRAAELFAEFLKQNPVEVWLEYHEKNQRAARFYKKLGFEEQGHRPYYYSDGGAAILCSLKR